MGDREDSARIVLQVLLEPEHRLGVEVVRRLVEEEQVRRLEQEPAEGHAPALATGEMGDRLIGVGALQGIHRLRELALEVPAIGRIDLVLELAHLGHQAVEVRIGCGHLLAYLVEAVDLRKQVAEGHLDVLEHGLVLVERRLLLEEPHRIARRQACLASRDILLASHDL